MIERLGRNIRAARMQRGITQQRLAELAGVSARTVANLEQPAGRKGDEASPTLAKILAVAQALGFEPWQLLVGSFDPEQPPILSDRSDDRLAADILAAVHGLDEPRLQLLQQAIRLHLRLPGENDGIQ